MYQSFILTFSVKTIAFINNLVCYELSVPHFVMFLYFMYVHALWLHPIACIYEDVVLFHHDVTINTIINLHTYIFIAYKIRSSSSPEVCVPMYVIVWRR